MLESPENEVTDALNFSRLSIDAATIDQPQQSVDLRDLRTRYYDGLNDFKDGFGAKDEPWANGLK